MGLGGEVGAGFRKPRKGESEVRRVIEIGGEEISASIIQGFDNDNIWTAKERGKPRLKVKNFLTGLEFNTSFNIIGLFIAGYTYSVGPKKVSKEVGLGTNPTSIEMSLYISFEANHSWCLNCESEKK